MRPGKASPPSEPCFFICKGIVVICDNCKDRLDVSRQKGFGISKVAFYRSGGDVLLVSCFGRELLGQGGGSHNHIQFGAMFRNLGIHSGDKRSGETWWLSFLGPQCETGNFEAARVQKKPHRPPHSQNPSSALLCVCPQTEMRAMVSRGSCFHSPRTRSSSLTLRLKQKVGKGVGQRTVPLTHLGLWSHPDCTPSVPTRAE